MAPDELCIIDKHENMIIKDDDHFAIMSSYKTCLYDILVDYL